MLSLKLTLLATILVVPLTAESEPIDQIKSLQDAVDYFEKLVKDEKAAHEAKQTATEAKMAVMEVKLLLQEKAAMEQKTELNAAKADVARMKTQTTMKRGIFTARADKDQTLGVDKQIIKFPTVLYNLGHDYNPATSIFTCPMDGIYLFHTSIISMPQGHVGVWIMKSGTPIGCTHAARGYSSAAVTVFTHCKKNERVWVALRYTYKAMHGNLWPHFSGALLQASVE